MELDFDSTIENFIKKNKVNNSEEEYVKDFKQKAERFLEQSKIKNASDVRMILLRMLGDYQYYSRLYIEEIFKNFYDYLVQRIKEESTIYSPISSEKDFTRMNSSYFYLQKFLEINDLSNEQAINLSSLYLDTSNRYYRKTLSHYNEKQKNGVNQQEREIKKVYSKLRYIDTVVFIDDFSGTGDTIRKFLRIAAEMVKDKQVIVFVIHITERAIKIINDSFEEFGYKNANLIFEHKSKSFFENYTELKDVRDKLLKFEQEVLESNHPLGFKETEALVTFYRNCPNNTISSYWWNENDEWEALFQRKNKILDFFGEKKLKELYEAIRYNLSLIIPNHLSKRYDIKEILHLLYLKEFPNDKEDFEIKKILGYNDKQLLEQHDKLLSKEWIDSQNNLTSKGGEILDELELKKADFSDLTRTKTLQVASDSLSFDDEYIPVRFP
ncbi:phosphoribosyltransferase [Priestia sp. AB]|uniref:phosphoribosyltransferase n=1 Tax=Priestia sp. AB TaxID=3020890 RepID=UPI00232EB457|nr:phosphoribosyltransferase [Priestia sp. AB]MDC0706237.1 phosphoribosyltransferase [Priestia sp. AB]